MDEKGLPIPIPSEVAGRARAATQPARLAGTLQDYVDALRPSLPVTVLWPERIAESAQHFIQNFPGEAMYAVKTNPDKVVLQTLFQNGIRAFDAASIEEVRMVRKALRGKGRIYFMHPVKSPESIREAYYTHGVRDFVLDSTEELYKIMRETDFAPNLGLFVRLALPRNKKASIDFSSKFGALPAEAAELLQKTRAVAERLGLCFHVGTQTTDPSVYKSAVYQASAVIKASGVKVDVLDVGGGFPVSYPGSEAPALPEFMNVITMALKREKLSHLPLLAEPGRYLVAQGGAVLARVELRKGNTLYLNDGTYGGLFDAGPVLNTNFPVRALRAQGETAFEPELQNFCFAGPTCDSLDMMRGPFFLPVDVEMGDWIEIGNLGSYSHSMRTNFNGFGSCQTVYLYDDPLNLKSRAPRKKTVKSDE